MANHSWCHCCGSARLSQPAHMQLSCSICCDEHTRQSSSCALCDNVSCRASRSTLSWTDVTWSLPCWPQIFSLSSRLCPATAPIPSGESNTSWYTSLVQQSTFVHTTTLWQQWEREMFQGCTNVVGPLYFARTWTCSACWPRMLTWIPAASFFVQ